jgi:glutamyl-tRNA(Gln) amidotransferase subunit E
LEKLKGVLGIELYEKRRFGTELSDRGKIYGFGGLIHGDEELSKYGINENEIREKMKLKKEDNFVILVGKNNEKMNFAFNEIFNRAYLKKVPGETRKAIVNCGSQFMRHISTGARMYPETDIPPIKVTKKLIKESEKYEPRDPEKVLIELEKETNKDLAIQLLKSKHLIDYKNAIEKNVDAKIAAVTFVNTLKNISRDKINVDNITGEEIIEILVKYKDKKITKKGIEEIIRIKCLNPKLLIENIIKENKLEKFSDKEIEKIIKEEEYDMKKIMMKYSNNVEASEIMELIKNMKK